MKASILSRKKLINIMLMELVLSNIDYIFLTIKSFTYLTYLDQSIDRHVCKIKPAYKRSVLYRAPCARRLRNMYEVEHFLALADSNLTIDLFCFDPQLHVHKEFVPVKVHSILFSL